MLAKLYTIQLNSFHLLHLHFSTTSNISYNISFSFIDNTSLDYRCSLVRVKASLPCLPSNKLLLRPSLLIGKVLPNSERTYLHFDLSYLLEFSAKQDLLPRSPEASPSYYIPKPTFAASLLARQLPILASLRRHLNSLPYVHHYYFVQNQPPLCLTSRPLLV